MEAIFSSKLYRTSSRKNKIAVALADPINLELVQQLSSYLDDEYQDIVEIQNFDDQNTKPVVDTDSDTGDADIVEESKDTISTPTTRISTDVPKDVEEPVETPEEIPLDKFHSPEKSESKDNEDTVEESTFINSSTSIYSPSIENQVPKAQVDAEAIKGTLNVRDDTRGVNRIFIRDNELWIYYQDKINLNSVMEPVIAILNSIGFTNLEFNRLARTENAIVFEISCVHNPIEAIVEEK